MGDMVETIRSARWRSVDRQCFFERCLFFFGGFSLCCSNVACEVNLVLAVVRQLGIAEVIATVTRDLSCHSKH